MQFGVMTYDFQDRFNVGDYIQSLAALRFLPRVDRYICRENLHEYSGPEMKVILNGHFMRYPANWPPSPGINPLFISFHINPRRAEGLLAEKGRAYLRDHGPIGCRDLSTLQLLEGKGIPGYFSSCLTLTLGSRYRHRSDENIFFVDVLFKYPTWQGMFKSLNSLKKALQSRAIFRLGKRDKLIENLLGREIVQSAEAITHEYSADAYPTEDSRFDLANRTLKRYETARLVVTSRIHCALPCLAMGTPVVFVNGGFRQHQAQRFTGISELLNTVGISSDGRVETNCDMESVRRDMSAPVKSEHLRYVEDLIRRCEQFVGEPQNQTADTR